MTNTKLRILLFESDEKLRGQFMDFLRLNPAFEVHSVGSAASAWQLLEINPTRFDVAVIGKEFALGTGGREILNLIDQKLPGIEVISLVPRDIPWGLKRWNSRLALEEIEQRILNAGRRARWNRDRKTLIALQRVTEAITSSLDIDEIMTETCKAAVEIFGFDHSGFVVFDPGGTEGKVVAEYPATARADGDPAVAKIIQVQGIPAEERLVRDKQVLNVPDLKKAEDLGPVRDLLIGLGVQSIVIVPVILDGRVVASFSLDAVRAPRVFDETEIQVCESLAAQLAIAIENARFYQEAQQQRTYIQSLWELTTNLISSREPDEVLDNIVNGVRSGTGAWRSVVALLNENRDLVVIKGVGFGGQLGPRNIRPAGISHAVLASGEARFIPDIRAVKDEINPRMLAQGTQSAACLPLCLAQTGIGVLWIQFKDKHTFSEPEQKALQVYANHAAFVYENARRMQELEIRAHGEAIASAGNVTEILRSIAEMACRSMGAECALVWPYQDGQFSADGLEAVGVPEDELEKMKLEEPGSGKTTWYVMGKGYVSVADVFSSEHKFINARTRDFFWKHGLTSFEGVRLQAGEEPMGVLLLDYRQQQPQMLPVLSDQRRRRLEEFARPAAEALRQARLRERLRQAQEAASVIAEVSVQENLDRSLQTIADRARIVLRCDTVNLYSWNQEQQAYGTWIVVGTTNRARAPKQLREGSAVYTILNERSEYYAEYNAQKDPLLKGEFNEQENIRSAFGIRLEAGGHRVGVMFFNYRAQHRFSNDDKEAIRMFAHLAAMAIRNSQLYDQTLKRADTLTALYSAGQAITGSLELDETLNRIAEQALTIIPGASAAPGCFSHVAWIENDNARFVAAYPRQVLKALCDRFPEIDMTGGRPTGIIGRAAHSLEPVRVEDVRLDPDYICFSPETRAQLSVPVALGDGAVIVLTIEHPEEKAFTWEDVENVKELAKHAAQVIENVREFGRTRRLVEARTALARIGMVSSTWHHSVRGKATVIRDSVDLLRRDLARGASPESIEKRLQSIEELTGLILEKRITPPLGSEQSVESVAMNLVIRERTKELWTREPYAMLQLELNLGLGDNVTVRASREWLRWALDILIDNVVDATAGQSERRLKITTSREGNRAVLSLSDNGPGIPEELRHQVLRQQISKPRGSKGQGTGLLMAQTIVEAFDGTLQVGATGKTGTTMVITLPVESEEESNGMYGPPVHRHGDPSITA